MFFYTFLPKLLNMSLTASVVIVLVLLLRLLLKKTPKAISYALWGIVLVRLLCPVSIESDFSLFRLLDTPVTESGTLTSRIEYVPSNIVHTENPNIELPVPGVADVINDVLPQGEEQAADKEPVIAWVNNFLPADWKEREGLWSTYYLTTIAECGLTFEDVPLNKKKVVNFGNAYKFEHGCGDYMRLRALVNLGLVAEPDVAGIIGSLSEKQLPDGGFLCLHRVDKMNRVPKSCVKANMLALMFCAECRKKGIKVDIEKPLLDYFWNHNIFYRTDNPETLILNAREGWRTIDTFYPFEVMRVGLQNVVEAFCALGYGNDSRLTEAWNILDSKRTPDGKYTLNGTLTKSYLPKERVGKPSKWVTFYALLAQKGIHHD